MNKVTVKIDGMMCGMCEAHVCDAIRRAFPDALRVRASRAKGEATFLMCGEVDEEKAERAISATGYRFLSVSSEPAKKRGIFGR